MGFALRVAGGPSAGSLFVLDSFGYMLIGRADDVSIRLSDADMMVSRHHALVEVMGDGVLVQDLADLGTTFLNDAPVSAGVLQVGDTLRLGKTSMRLELHDVGALDDGGLTADARNELYRAAAPPTPTGYTIVPTRPERISLGGDEDDLDGDAVSDGIAALREPTFAPHDDALERLRCDSCGVEGIYPPEPDLAGASWLCSRCVEKATRLGPYDPPTLGNFRMIRQMAVGGMGSVYEGVAIGTGIRAAVKVIILEPPPPDRVILRFLREQRITRALRHPNIVRSYEVGAHWGRPYIAMEFVDGGDALTLARSDSPADEILWLGADLFRALAHAHHRGVVHRDVKPGNLMLTRPERTGARRGKLTDFGLAKNARSSGSQKITNRGEAGGSVLMLSPEQLQSFTEVGPSGDLYSAGATLFRLLTGATHLVLQRPMLDAPIHEVGAAILARERVPIASLRSDLPQEVCELIDGLVAFDSTDRDKLEAADIASLLDRWASKLRARA